jgi:arginine utilization protein RocB
MINSIDQSSDYSNRELYTFLTGINLPDFVKTASLEEIRGDDSMAKTAFADELGRKFPIDTPARAYVSTAHFVNKVAALAKLRGKLYTEKVANQLDLAASVFGIQTEISDLVKTAYLRNKEDYVDRSVVLKIAQDEITLFTIKTAEDLTYSANKFAAEVNKYPFEWRRTISEELVKAAEQLGVDELPGLVLKYAGQYYPNIVDVKEELQRRMSKLSEQDRGRYAQLVEDVNNISDKEEIFKLAECCYFTEKNAGLYEKAETRRILGDPVDRLFTMHFDKVAEALDVIEMGGEKFATTDLHQVPSDIYFKSFGFELDPKSAEAKDILPTMPKSDVSLFKQLSGVKPI